MSCVHLFEAHVPGWFLDHLGDLRREYVCRLCGEVALFGPGEYPNGHLWPGQGFEGT